MKTLVIIDSDALTRAVFAQCMAGAGWRVLEADNGEAGVELAIEHAPAAVLCDVRTPRRNGFKVCRLIREQPFLKSTRVILTSVSQFLNDRETAFAAGADDFLVKPIVPAELAGILATCGLDEAPAAPDPAPARRGAIEPTLVRFWGVRGSIPSPGPGTAGVGGNTSCVEVRAAGQIIVFDAGSGIRQLGRALLEEFAERQLTITMLVTHTHWDHIQGFPFFMPAYSACAHVRILGYEGAVHGLRSALFEQMQSAFFPVGLNQMASHVTFEELHDMEFAIGPVKVRAIFANHPGICLAYRLSTPTGDLVFMPDHEAYERQEIERQRATGQQGNSHQVEHARLQDEKTVEFLRGADLVIADGQYTSSEYRERRGWGHSCADDTAALAARAGVRRLALFHHDPDHDDDMVQAMERHAQRIAAEKGSPLVVTAAREGAEIVLTPLAGQ